ncbi:MAG: PEP-CTERM sorting domain-containing protein [Sideroxyarcus sp.]
MKFLNIVFVLIGLASIFPANAANSVTSSLNIISTPSIGTGSLGEVTITQTSSTTVEFSVALAPATAFVSTGGPHHAFTFNLELSTPYSILFNNPDNGMFVYTGGSAVNTPYGKFYNAIDCPGCGPGASNAYFGVLNFTITGNTGISLSDFVANSGGYFFSADVIGPLGGTGNIAANAITPLVTPVPEPQTYAMLLAGLAFIGFSARRKKDFAV